MSRFILSPSATEDLDGILAYLRGIPVVPANQIGQALRVALKIVTDRPMQGFRHTEYSHLFQAEIRSWVSGDYVLYYASTGKPRLILGIIHAKRDSISIMQERLK